MGKDMTFKKWLKKVSEQYNVTEDFCLGVLDDALIDIHKAIADFESGRISYQVFYQMARGTSVTMCFDNLLTLLDDEELCLNDFQKELDFYRADILV